MSADANGGDAAMLKLALAEAGRGRVGVIFALILAISLTEGVGLAMLVPILATLDGAGPGAAPDLLARLQGWGIPMRVAPLLAIFVALVTLRALLQYALAVAQKRCELELVDGWRERVFAALLGSEYRSLAARQRARDISLLVANIDRIGFGFTQVLRAGAALATVLTIWALALLLAPLVAMAGAVGGALMMLAFVRLRRRSRALGEAMSAQYGAVQSVLQDGLGAFRLVKSLGRERETGRQLGDAIAALRGAQIAFVQAFGRVRATMQVGGALVLAIVAAVAVSRGVSTIVLLPLIVLFARSVPLLDTLQYGIQQWALSAPAMREAAALVEAARATAEPSAADMPRPPRPAREIAVEAAHVRHAGREEPALHDVTLRLPVNTTTALIGPSGAGKSTLADIFGGLLIANEGGLAIDGQRLSREQAIGWRRAVAYVHQEAVMVHGTIRENLRWAEPDADDARIGVALNAAAADFVHDLPRGLDTPVGEGGGALSGGERQRIALARALLRDPALLILDEATSAIDAANEAAIAQAIAALEGSRTILIIGHRGALVDRAARTVRIEAGRIAGEMAAP